MGPHPPRENYFVSLSTLVYEISQTWLFYKFVFEVWEICFFKHADIKEKIFFGGPTHNEKIILSRSLPWSMKYLKFDCFIDLFIEFERFTFSSVLTFKKKKLGAPPTTRKLFCLVVFPGQSNLSNLNVSQICL